MNKNYYQIKSFKGGKSPFKDKGIPGSFKRGSNLNIRADIDALQCNQALKIEGAGVIVDLVNFWVPCNDGNTYGFGSLGKIYKRIPAGTITVVHTDADGAILGAAQWFDASKTFLYWATAQKLHRKEIAGATDWSDVDATVASVAATGVLTVSDIPHNNSTVTIGDIIYRFVTTLSASPVYNEVKIGASAEASIDNLVAAINLAAGSGTTYSTNIVVHPTTSAAKTTSATMTITAKNAGDTGNGISTSAAGDHLSFAKSFLTGGLTYSTWPKINLDSATWHTMNQANGSLMICNKDKLAMVGYDDSYTNEALKLRPGCIASAVLEYGNIVLAGGGDGAKDSYLLTWEQTALNWLSKNRIPSKSINGIADSELLLMNCGDDELYFSDMVNKISILKMDGKCQPGGVTDDHGLALFGIYGGSYPGIYSYGRKNKEGSYTHNLEYAIDADIIGSVLNIGSTILVSYKKGTSYYSASVDSANKAVAEYVCLNLKAPAGRDVAWTKLDMVTDDLPTGSKIEVFTWNTTDSDYTTVAKLANGNSSFTVGRDPSFALSIPAKIFDFKVKITPVGNLTPVIHEIYVYFN